MTGLYDVAEEQQKSRLQFVGFVSNYYAFGLARESTLFSSVGTFCVLNPGFNEPISLAFSGLH